MVTFLRFVSRFNAIVVSTILLLSLLPAACNKKQAHPNVVIIAPITTDSLVKLIEDPLRKDYLAQRAIEKGEFVPTDTSCRDTLILQPAQHFNYHYIQRCFEQTDAVAMADALTRTLYLLIPEELNVHEHSCHFADVSAQVLFDSLAQGRWAFICNGHAEVVAKFVTALGNGKYIGKVVTVQIPDNDSSKHVVALLYYQKDREWYGLAIDAQNGVAGPYLNNNAQLPPVNAWTLFLQESDTALLSLKFLPDSVLHKKRTLMNEPLPCNMFPEKEATYCVAPAASGYALERLSYSQLYYTWFYRQQMNKQQYAVNLARLLIQHRP